MVSIVAAALNLIIGLFFRYILVSNVAKSNAMT